MCDWIAPLLNTSAWQVAAACHALWREFVHAYSPLGPGREPGHVRAIQNLRLDTRRRDRCRDHHHGAWRVVRGGSAQPRLIGRADVVPRRHRFCSMPEVSARALAYIFAVGPGVTMMGAMTPLCPVLS